MIPRMRLREVPLEPPVSGRLILAEIPGRWHELSDDIGTIQQAGVATVFCLTPLDEIWHVSPSYALAIEEHRLPFTLQRCPLPESGLPYDWSTFNRALDRAATALRAGEIILVHCTQGIGRTGMFACCLLITLSFPYEDAVRIVRAAGSYPDTPEEQRIVERFGK